VFCIINGIIIRIIYNLLIKNIIDMSVDTVNTIVDITTLAQVQNELTMLADPAKLVGTPVACIGGAAGNMATVCLKDNITCSGTCTAAPAAADTCKATGIDCMTVVDAFKIMTATGATICTPADGAFFDVPAVTTVPKVDAYKVTCPAAAMFLKVVSSVVAATMVMHLA
jgi:hypothetical protein